MDNHFFFVVNIIYFPSLETLDDHGGLVLRVELAGRPVQLLVIINPKQLVFVGGD